MSKHIAGELLLGLDWIITLACVLYAEPYLKRLLRNAKPDIEIAE